MFFSIVRAQFVLPGQSIRLHVAASSVAAVTAAAALLGLRHSPQTMIEWLKWSYFFTGLIVGACLTGWRIAQFPKSRACEFYLVTPVSSATFVLAEIFAGTLRTAYVLMAAFPGTMALLGLGLFSWYDVSAVMILPVMAGCLTEIGLATVAYEPPRVRKLLERLFLGSIVAYLVLFGLLGHYAAPWFFDAWSRRFDVSGDSLASFQFLLFYFNPFRLLDSVGNADRTSAGLPRILAVSTVLSTVCGLCLWRMACRLRHHSREENYAQRSGKQKFTRLIGNKPLSWWTARRVSQFKGNINLYLAWATVGLFIAWMVFRDQWPYWLAQRQLYLLEVYGGAPLLAALALQMAVVPTAFLNGLWDSNAQVRCRRLELLLTTPLSGWDYLQGSMVAGWTRGRGYVLAALSLWIAMAVTGRISWAACAACLLLAGNFLVLYFAAAFRNFARLSDDGSVSTRGLLWSVGPPALTLLLFQADWTLAGVATPLGAVYFASLAPLEQAQAVGTMTGWPWAIIVAENLLFLLAAVWSLREGVRRFDTEIREWFSQYHAGGKKKKAKGGNRRDQLVHTHLSMEHGAALVRP